MRRGLVLGGGGVLGAAWTIGALTSYEEITGCDSRDFDLILGTSAGSVVSAMLGCGVSVADLLSHQSGGAITDGPLAGYDWDYDVATGQATPTRPRWSGANPRSLLRNARRIKEMPPSAVLAALVPEGTGSLQQIHDLVSSASTTEWPQNVWISTFNYDFGYRVIFGRNDAPKAELADAVCASCAIPGWYSPILIDGNRYVDGGTWSPTSADAFTDQDLDEVLVVAPMASFDIDHPRDLSTTVERAWRIRVTKRLVREVGRLRRRGVRVRTLTPTFEDLAVMGGNFMDPAKRRAVLDLSLVTTRRTLTLHH